MSVLSQAADETGFEQWWQTTEISHDEFLSHAALASYRAIAHAAWDAARRALAAEGTDLPRSSPWSHDA